MLRYSSRRRSTPFKGLSLLRHAKLVVTKPSSNARLSAARKHVMSRLKELLERGFPFFLGLSCSALRHAAM